MMVSKKQIFYRIRRGFLAPVALLLAVSCFPLRLAGTAQPARPVMSNPVGAGKYSAAIWSPDSSKVAFIFDPVETYDQQLWVLDIATKKLTRIETVDDLDFNVGAIWENDTSILLKERESPNDYLTRVNVGLNHTERVIDMQYLRQNRT